MFFFFVGMGNPIFSYTLYLQSEGFSWIKVLTMCSEQIPYNQKLILFTCIFPEFTNSVNIDKALV